LAIASIVFYVFRAVVNLVTYTQKGFADKPQESVADETCSNKTRGTTNRKR